MRRISLIGFLFVLAAGCGFGQQATPAPIPAAAPAATALAPTIQAPAAKNPALKPPVPVPERVKVYAIGKGVSAPRILPFSTEGLPRKTCDFRQDGVVKLSLLVDTAGRPRDIMFLRPLGVDLDGFALLVAEANRFTPGKFKDTPVVVAASLEIDLQACIEQAMDGAGKPARVWKLRSVPRQRLSRLKNPPEEAVLSSGSYALKMDARPAIRPDYFGPDTIPPTLLLAADAAYPAAALRAKLTGKCLVSLTVDAHGMPQNVRVARSLSPLVDFSAVHAVEHYRFIPAIRNGEPVASVVTVNVEFAPPRTLLEVEGMDVE